MSKHQPRQTKWVLTACLLGALGFSASLPTKEAAQYALRVEQENSGVLMMASEEPTQQTKRIEVTDLKGKKTQAIVRRHTDNKIKVITEADACRAGDCLNETVLDLPFNANADDISNMLLIARKALAQHEKPVNDKDEDPEKDKEKVQREKDRAAMAKIARECRRTDREDLAKCIVNDLTDFLKDREDGKYPVHKEDAFRFYDRELRGTLRELLLADSEQGSHEFRKASDLIRKLQSSLPRAFDNIRQDAIKLAREAVSDRARSIAQLHEKLQASANRLKPLQDGFNNRMQQLLNARSQAVNAGNWGAISQLDAEMQRMRTDLATAQHDYQNDQRAAAIYRSAFERAFIPQLRADIYGGLQSAGTSVVSSAQLSSWYRPFHDYTQPFINGNYQVIDRIVVDPATGVTTLVAPATTVVQPQHATIPAVPPAFVTRGSAVIIQPATVRQANPTVLQRK